MNNVHSVQEYLNLEEVKAAAAFVLAVTEAALED